MTITGRINKRGKWFIHNRPDGYVTITCSGPPEKRPARPRRLSWWARLQAWWDANVEGKP
jgi:hypothetical protein